MQLNIHEYKDKKDENDEFLKRYNKIKKIVEEQDARVPGKISGPLAVFQDLICKYKSIGYKLPDLSIQKNIFKPCPLLMDDSKIDTFYKSLSSNEISNKTLQFLIHLNIQLTEKLNSEGKILAKMEKRFSLGKPRRSKSEDFESIITDELTKDIEKNINDIKNIRNTILDMTSFKSSSKKIKGMNTAKTFIMTEEEFRKKSGEKRRFSIKTHKTDLLSVNSSQITNVPNTAFQSTNTSMLTTNNRIISPIPLHNSISVKAPHIKTENILNINSSKGFNGDKIKLKSKIKSMDMTSKPNINKSDTINFLENKSSRYGSIDYGKKKTHFKIEPKIEKIKKKIPIKEALFQIEVDEDKNLTLNNKFKINETCSPINEKLTSESNSNATSANQYLLRINSMNKAFNPINHPEKTNRKNQSQITFSSFYEGGKLINKKLELENIYERVNKKDYADVYSDITTYFKDIKKYSGALGSIQDIK